MNDLTQIKQTGRKMRIGFWVIILVSIALIVGIPPVFNIHIELIEQNTWLYSLFSLVEAFFPQYDDTSWSALNKALLVLGFLLLTALFLLLIGAIDRLFFQYEQGEVFTQACAKYFRLIGYSLVAIFIVDNLFSNWIEHIYSSQDPIEGAPSGEESFYPESLNMEFEADFLAQVIALDFSYLMAGLFVLAVAKAVVLGVALQEDVDATV